MKFLGNILPWKRNSTGKGEKQEKIIPPTQQVPLSLDHSNKELRSDRIVQIAEDLENNSTVQNLYLFNNKIGSIGALVDALQKNSTLRLLDLHGNNIDSRGAEALAQTLKMSHTLRVLNLGDNIIDTQGARALGNALKDNSSLQTLNISHNPIQSSGILALAKGLEENSTLLKLIAVETDFDDLGAHALGQALAVNCTLQELNVSCNFISSCGVGDLCEALRMNFSLQMLRLSVNQNDSRSFSPLVHALRVNSTLQQLDITRYKTCSEEIYEETVNDVRKAESLLRKFIDRNRIISTFLNEHCPSTDTQLRVHRELRQNGLVSVLDNSCIGVLLRHILKKSATVSCSTQTENDDLIHINTAQSSVPENGNSFNMLCHQLLSRKNQVSSSLDEFFAKREEWNKMKEGRSSPSDEQEFIHGFPSLYSTLLTNLNVSFVDNEILDNLNTIALIGPLANELLLCLSEMKELSEWKEQHDNCSALCSKLNSLHTMLLKAENDLEDLEIRFRSDLREKRLKVSQKKTVQARLHELRAEVSSIKLSMDKSFDNLCDYPMNIRTSYLQQVEESMLPNGDASAVKELTGKLLHHGKILYRNYDTDYVEKKPMARSRSIFRAKCAVNNNEVVLKKLPFRDTFEENMAWNELNLLLSLQNRPYVIELNGAFIRESDDDNELILEMPFCPHGNLMHWLKKKKYDASAAYNARKIRKKPTARSEQEIILLFLQIVEAVGELHSLGIEHRDLKPENILIDGSGSMARVKLIDFGIGKDSSMSFSTTMKTSNGINTQMTAQYAPPERKSFWDTRDSDASTVSPIEGSWDMYSLGVILYEMLCAPNRLYQNLLSLSVQPPEVPAKSGMLDEWSFNLVKSLLSPDAHSRPSAREVCLQLKRNLYDQHYEIRNRAERLKHTARIALVVSMTSAVKMHWTKHFTVRRSYLVEDTLSYFGSLQSRSSLLCNHKVQFEGETGIGSGVFRDLCTEVTRVLLGCHNNTDIESPQFERNGSHEWEFFSPVDGREVQKEMEAFGRLVFYCVARNYTLRLRLSPLVYCTLVEHIPKTVSGWLDLLRPYDSSIRLLEPHLHSSKSSNRETAESLLEEKKKSLQGSTYRMKNIEHFCRGFTSCMLPEEKEKPLLLSWRDAQLLCSGREVISPATVLRVMKRFWKADEWKQSPQHKNTAKWFKEWIRKQDSDGLRLFLGFSTGLNTLPMDLRTFCIRVVPCNSFASSSTCFNEVRIGTECSSKEEFFSMMDQVIENCYLDGQRQLED